MQLKSINISHLHNWQKAKNLTIYSVGKAVAKQAMWYMNDWYAKIAQPL